MIARYASNRIYIRIILAAYIAIGLTLIIQPGRYANTPSYANLIDIFPQWVWGIIYLVVAGLLLAARATPSVIVGTIAHTIAIALTASWLLAFVYRYATDKGTTVVNVASWGVFLSLLIISAVRLNDRPVELPPTESDREAAGK